MRFGVVHRVMTDALAALGVLALLTSGELDPWVYASCWCGLVVALLLPEPLQIKPALAALRAVALASRCSWSRLRSRCERARALLVVAIEFAAGLQIIRLATRRGAAHDQQVIVLALLHLIAGTVLGGGLTYGLCFLGFLVVAPGALVLSHLRREVEGNYRQGARDRTGLPVDVPRILRSRRVIGPAVPAAHLPARRCRSSCSRRLLFVLVPAGRPLALAGEPTRARRAWSASPTTSISARSACSAPIRRSPFASTSRTSRTQRPRD